MKALIPIILALIFSCSGEDPGPSCDEYQRRVEKYEALWIDAQELISGDFTTQDQWDIYYRAKADYDLALEEYDYYCHD